MNPAPKTSAEAVNVIRPAACFPGRPGMSGKGWDKPHALRSPFEGVDAHSVSLSPLAPRTALDSLSPSLPGFVYNKARTLEYIAEIFSPILETDLSGRDLQALRIYIRRAKDYSGGAQRLQDGGMSPRAKKNWRILLDGALQNILCGLVVIHKTVIKSKNIKSRQEGAKSALDYATGVEKRGRGFKDWIRKNAMPPMNDIEEIADEEGLDPDMIDEVLDQIDPDLPPDVAKEKPGAKAGKIFKGTGIIAAAAVGGLILFTRK